MTKKRGAPRSYSCYICNTPILRVGSHRFQNVRYCNSCWEIYQNAWKYNIDNWVNNYGSNIKALDEFYPQLAGKGYYVTIEGDIYRTKQINKAKNSSTLSTFYLPKPIKCSIPSHTPELRYGEKRYSLKIKDIVYTAFKGPFSKEYIIINKDGDIFNNHLDNLVKYYRKGNVSKHIYYAMKNGQIIAESKTLEGLAKVTKISPEFAGYLYRTGKKSKHGIYVKRK